jgi:hypothetical protein
MKAAVECAHSGNTLSTRHCDSPRAPLNNVANMYKKRPRTRRKPKKAVKGARLHIRLTQEQHAAYCLAAERGGFDDLSVWVRLVLDLAAVTPLRYDAYRQAAARAGFFEVPRWILSVLDSASGLAPSGQLDGH